MKSISFICPLHWSTSDGTESLEEDWLSLTDESTVNFLEQLDQLFQLQIAQMRGRVPFEMCDHLFQLTELLGACIGQFQIDRTFV